VQVGDEKTSWDINYNSIFTYNLKATQELKIQNDGLKIENDGLKRRLSELEMKVNLIMEKL